MSGTSGGGGGTTGAAKYLTNATPANLSLLTYKLNRMLRYGEKLRINLYGDSITFGSGGSFQKNSPGQMLAANLNRRGLKASANLYGYGSAGTIAATTTWEPRLTFTGSGWGGWTELQGGNTFRSTGNADTITYTPGYVHDTVDLFWVRGRGFGSEGNMTIALVDASNFSWATYLGSGGSAIASGGPVASTTISQVGAFNFMKTTITFASAGARAVKITNGATNNIEICSFEPYTAGVGEILIRCMGQSGATSSDLVVANRNVCIQQTPCELSILCIGRNDWDAPVALGTYSANLATLNTAMVANAISTLLYWTPPPTQFATNSKSLQQSYVNAMKTAAGSTIVVADLWQRYVDMGGEEALAATLAGYYNDTIHPSALGHFDIAGFLLGALMRDGQ